MSIEKTQCEDDVADCVYGLLWNPLNHNQIIAYTAYRINIYDVKLYNVELLKTYIGKNIYWAITDLDAHKTKPYIAYCTLTHSVTVISISIITTHRAT